MFALLGFLVSLQSETEPSRRCILCKDKTDSVVMINQKVRYKEITGFKSSMLHLKLSLIINQSYLATACDI